MDTAGDAESAQAPLTVDLVADLQAGLLSDADAARVRRRIRDDPDATAIVDALAAVRNDLAALGTESATASDVPAEVTARIADALAAASASEAAGAKHAARPPLRALRITALVIGVIAAVSGVVFGTTSLLANPDPKSDGLVNAEHITVSSTAPIPLSVPQIREMLVSPTDYGFLGDDRRRTSCLSGLGYPAAIEILGAQPLQIDHRSAEVLVLPGDTPDMLTVYAVGANCSGIDTGLIATTSVPRA